MVRHLYILLSNIPETVDQDLIPKLSKGDFCPGNLERIKKNLTCCCPNDRDEKCCWDNCKIEPPIKNCLNPYLPNSYWVFDIDKGFYVAQHPKGNI